ncbi:hypothetical protein OEZ85_009885 [Tetradesmus obliquus]|uniref:Uncharacterized protein n=1 Tax=Tetradesmus obliquus TaxID=3088 RepID=A0ABY8UB60_TETOB|nr:hypothetical protein OEZ85_009885 [Tetradesmus obliquus]
MRQEVTSHIRKAASALNTNGCADDGEHDTGDIGSFATKVAAVARMCKIPDTEVLYEAVGQATGTYRRRSSCVPDIEVCTAYGPTYMKQKQHRHWYHPMTSSASSSADAPLSGSSSSSEEELQPGFQTDFDSSDSATCTPTYAGDEACLGMLLGTSFRRRQ